MSYLKKILVFVAVIILYVLFVFINLYGCGKNNDDSDKSYEALQIFAAIEENQEETNPPTEIVSGTISLSKDDNTNNTEDIKDTYIETTEVPTIIEFEEATKSPETTEDTNAPILYVITPSGKKYHYPTCRTVKTIKQYITKEEAEQLGYEPCKICNP